MSMVTKEKSAPTATVLQHGNRITGRVAAERLWEEWGGDSSWVPQNPDAAWASEAVERLGEIIRAQPGAIKATIEGSERGAESLSARPFQGIQESLQNADDQGANELRIGVRRKGKARELLIVHNGVPVELNHVVAMLLPWVSTKRDDPEASGRFGIGQKTLVALGGPVSVHCSSYHFTITTDGPVPCPAYPSVRNLYEPDEKDTLVVLPLLPHVETEDLKTFVADLGAESLLFLRTVRRLAYVDTKTGKAEIDNRVRAGTKRKVPMSIGGNSIDAECVELRESGSRRRYLRYVVDLPLPKGEHRYHKRTGATTPLGVLVITSGKGAGRLFDRLPLPIHIPFQFSMNAQFDPDTARSTLLQREWNVHRLRDLGQLLTSVAFDCFARDPASGWRAVPLTHEVTQINEWLDDQIMREVARFVRESMIRQLQLPGDGVLRPIRELVYENGQLDGLLTQVDQKYLRPDKHPLDLACRDADGRWRLVLDDLKVSTVIETDEAMELFDQSDNELGERDPTWYVAMARAAIRDYCITELTSKRSILLSGGERVDPPDEDDPRSLVCEVDPESLAAALGIALVIHPSYLAETSDAIFVSQELRDRGLLLQECNSSQSALDILARDSDGGLAGRVKLSDQQLTSLRDAFERIDEEQQRRIGPRIGANIEVRSIRYLQNGQRVEQFAPPSEAYLPATIDREPDSFARAAARTTLISWLDPSYARLLKRTGGRRELGAQRFLSRLGAAAFPRLMRPTNEREFYKRDTRPASSISEVDRPEIQEREIRSLPNYRTHLLNDRWSPDLDAVIGSIQRDQSSKRRRRRAQALLGTLVRAWERHYADFRSAQAVHAYDGYFQDPHEVIATWLARAASEPWLPSASGVLTAPMELYLPTEANRLIYRKKGLFLFKVDEQILRSGGLVALRLRRGPSALDLVSKLSDLPGRPVTKEVESDAATIYRMIAPLVPSDRRVRPVDDMSLAEFRRAFTYGTGKGGLLLVDGVGRAPSEVFRGPSILGKHRPFVPNAPNLEPLWKLLEIPEPGPSDCLAVLREVARRPLSSDDQAVILDTLRGLANTLPTLSHQMRAQLRRLSLWNGERWLTERPVYAIEDDELATRLASKIPVWKSGFSQLNELGELVEALGVEIIPPDTFAASTTVAADVVTGESLRNHFALAVSHLNDELARGDSQLYHSASIDWSRLGAAALVVDERLTLSGVVGGVRIRVPARAHMRRDPLTLLVASVEDLGSAETGGRAIASLFSGDRQKVAWAWAAMWQRAADGVAAKGIVLSGVEHDDESYGRLIQLGDQAKQRRARAESDGRKRLPPAAGTDTEIRIRPLKDINDLSPNEPSVVNRGASKQGLSLPPAVKRKLKEQFSGGKSTGGNSGSGAGSRSVLPPASEREQLALDAVQRALWLDNKRLVDLRSRRGIGADAMDDMRQLFEMKMASGSEFPREVTLQRHQVDAAQNDPDFFLAVVCGLEEDADDLRVRFIFDPLEHLGVRIKGEVTLTGVDEVEALEVRLGKGSESDQNS